MIKVEPRDLTTLLPLDALEGPRAFPLVGALPWVIRRNGMMAGIGDIGERYRARGMYKMTFPGGRSSTFVVNASVATETCNEALWEKVIDGPLPRIRDFAGDGLFTAYNHEEAWHRAHRILTPGFSSTSMQRYFPAMLEVAEDLIAHWRRAREPVDVVSDMTRLTLDTISLCGFNHRFRSFEQVELDPFLQSLARALQEASDALARPPLIAPYEAWKRRRFDADVASMFALVDRVIEQRKTLARELWPQDFLSLMLAAVDPKTGETLSDANIRYQILTFLIAGHETTSGLLAFTLHRLACDPALVRRLREEIQRELGAHEPTLEGVQALDLVSRTLREALRLWPTVPAISRAPREDTILGGRYRVGAGKPVTLLLGSIHRDPTVWRDPERFDPDRFLPEAAKGRPAGAYKPFGIGKRACTGRNFALIEATLCLVLILQAFELDAAAPLRVASTVSPKPRGFLLGLRTPDKLNSTRRSSRSGSQPG